MRLALLVLIYFAGFACVGLANWIGNSFGNPSMDQVLYHLRYSEDAAIEMSGIFLATFLVEVLAFPAAFAVLAAWLHRRLEQTQHLRVRRVATMAPHAAWIAGAGALLAQFSAFSYAAAHFADDAFGLHYVDPARIEIGAGSGRNLILIYAESLEESYGRADLFGTDLLAPLRMPEGRSVASYRQATGTTWTIAGMVATQCGIPLRVYSEREVKTSASRTYLAGATCLGDILQARGYKTVFMGGAPLSFAGKGVFLRDHGIMERYGRDEWGLLGTGAEEQNEWGLYDDALLRRAKSRLKQLHASGEPFFLTLLTLDTHNPFGFLSGECRSRGAQDFAGIVSCSARQLSEFVAFARDQGYLADTTLVIIGDHLAAPNPLHDKLRRIEDRRLFNLFVAQPSPAFAAKSMNPFDMFPTLLELLGIQVPGNRLGLGYSAVSVPSRPPVEPSLAGLSGSRAYARLWQQPP